MEEFLAFCNKTQGRDKLYRVTQYGSKLLAWHFAQKGSEQNVINTLSKLETSMSTSRKLFRFGRSIDSLRAAQRAINLQNYILRLTLTTSHTNKAFYLLVDHYIWLGKVGLIQVDLKRWSKVAARFWLASLITAFIRDFYSLYVGMERRLQNTKFEDESSKFKASRGPRLLFQVILDNPQATVDIVKNACDIVIPMTSLGYFNFNNGVVGLCGVISSLLGVMQIAQPSSKLRP